MKLTVIASVLVMLTSEFSIGLASTVDHSIDSAYHENSGSVSQLLTVFTGNQDTENENYKPNDFPDEGSGGSRYK